MSLQEAIKMLRCELEVTQGELAEKLKIDLSTISRWERGKTYPNKAVSKEILSLADKENVSENCREYLYEVLNVTRRRVHTASGFGYPELDRELLCQIADGSSNMIYITDYKSRELIYVNRVCEKFVGKSFAEAEDKRCYKYIMNQDKPCKLCSMKKYNYSWFYEDKIMERDGDIFLQIRGKKIRWNKKTVAVTYITDVSELIKAKNQFIRLSNDLPIGMAIFYVYKDGHFESFFANDNYLRMVNIKCEEDFKDNPFAGLLNIKEKDKKRLLCEVNMAIKEDRDINCQFHILEREEKHKLIHVCGKIIEKNNERSTVCGYFMDIDSMKKMNH